MIRVEGLKKSYAGTGFAVKDVSFRVEQGEVVGFLGPNGAGKSTTLRVVAGFLGPTEGKITLGGKDLAEDPIEARAQVGYMPEAVPLYPEMRVREYLSFRAEIKRVPRRARRAEVGVAMERAQVSDVADKLIGHLSKGYRQRVGLADALVGKPPILILDEPTAGLDPNQIREVRSLICELGREHAILLSTHILTEAEATCARALVISHGSLVAEGSIDELRTLSESRAVRVVVRPGVEIAAALAGDEAIARIAAAGPGTFVVNFRDATSDIDLATEAIAQKLVTAGIGLRELVPVRASLEQVFAELTRPEMTA